MFKVVALAHAVGLLIGVEKRCSDPATLF